MREGKRIMITLLLAAALTMSGCGGGDAVEVQVSTADTSENAAPESITGVRMLLAFGDKELAGFGTGNWAEQMTSVEEVATEEMEDADRAALSFSLKKEGESYLAVTGTISMGQDVTKLFDFATEEEYTDEEDAVAEDPYAGASDTEGFLSSAAAAYLSDTEDAALTESAEGALRWRYGFSETEKEGDTAAIRFCAFTVEDGVYIYITGGAFSSGAEDADTELNRVREELMKWLTELSVRPHTMETEEGETS